MHKTKDPSLVGTILIILCVMALVLVTGLTGCGSVETSGDEVYDRFVAYDVANASAKYDTVIDMQTGVVYLRWRSNGSVGGITPLLDEDGQPTIDMGFVEAHR